MNGAVDGRERIEVPEVVLREYDVSISLPSCPTNLFHAMRAARRLTFYLSHASFCERRLQTFARRFHLSDAAAP